jgi:hypothetical protein
VTFTGRRARLRVGIVPKGSQGASISGREEPLTGPSVGWRLGMVMRGWEVVCADGT